MASSLAYRKDIDGLRAVAVLLVVAFHAFPRVLPGGFIGVDVFFVISGFLITSILIDAIEKNRFSVVEFYARRAVRLAPALTIVLFGTWVIGREHLLADEYQQLGRHLAAGAGFVSNFVLWSEAGYFDSSSEGKPLLHLWSLAIEEQFYILWPALLWLAYRRTVNALWLVLGISVASFGINLYSVDRWPSAAFYLLPSRFWELSIGCVVALAVRKSSAREILSPRMLMALSLAPAVLLVAGLAARAEHFPGCMALFPTIATAIYLWVGEPGIFNRLLSNWVACYVGKISYPLYLWHWPLLAYAFVRFEAAVPEKTSWRLVGLSFLLAILTRELLERPIQSRAPGYSRRVRLAAMLVPLGLMGLVGWSVHRGSFHTAAQKDQLALTRYWNYHEKIDLKDGPWRCFIGDPAGRFDDFDKRCLEAARSAEIVGWGDSRMAQYVGALEKYFGERKRSFAFLGLSGCQPVLGLDVENRKYCRVTNDRIFELLAKHPPKIVVLGGSWTSLWQDEGALAKIRATVERLKKAGVGRVLVLGQSAEWEVPLYKTLARIRRELPERLPPLKALEQIEPVLGEIVTTAGGDPIGVFDHVCHTEGCQTFVSYGGERELLVYDQGHLTNTGAAYLVNEVIGPAIVRD